jgi:hypothetical protein
MHCYLVIKHIDGKKRYLDDYDVLVGDDLEHRTKGAEARHSSEFTEPTGPAMYGPYKKIIYLGDTNVSLWRDDVGAYFRATFEDLTEEGKELIRSLRCSDARILTFLET